MKRSALTPEEDIAALVAYSMDFSFIWQAARGMDRGPFCHALSAWLSASPFGPLPTTYCDHVYDAIRNYEREN